MWLDEQIAATLGHPGPTIFTAPVSYGVAHILEGLHRPERPLVWLELEEGDRDDPIAQGNKLVEAVRRALGSSVLPSGLPFQYGVHFLKRNLPLLGPFVFALSGAEYSPALAHALLELDGADRPTGAGTGDRESRVALAFAAPEALVELPEHARLVTTGELALTPEQALDLAAGRLPDDEALQLHHRSHGAYLSFLTAVHERLRLPLAPRPSPTGPHLPPGRELLVEPERLLSVLIAKRRWTEALSVAAEYLPASVPEVLHEAGHVYHELGLHQRLEQLLAQLPPESARHEEVLRWRLVAATRLGRHRELLPEVERHLQRHEAPELRATYAALLPEPAQREAEAERAHRALETPFTTFQYGRLARDPTTADELLRRSVTLAEARGHPYEVARNAGALASHLLRQGQYREAVHWSGWALEYFDRHELADGQRRLYLLNDWAYARLLTGDTVELATPLAEAEPHLAIAFPALARYFRSTLGNYMVATGRPAEALPYFRANWESAPRAELGMAGLNMVRALLEVGEVTAAGEVAERAITLTRHDTPQLHLLAVLALGMVLALDGDPATAETHLRKLLAPLPDGSTLPAYYRAQATLYRAMLALGADDPQRANDLLRQSREVLAELSSTGLKLLSGPAALFAPLWDLVQGRSAPLQLKLLGQGEVWLEGRPLEVPPQWVEILTILALSRDRRALTLEQLHTELMGERGNPSNLKSVLSKMRRQLPVSRHPYTLTVAVATDADTVEEKLEAGQVREALSLYRGPLLPSSDAPAIRAAREALEAQLREAVLASGDADSLLTLAERLGDDLELWHCAERALKDKDPRTPLVRARIHQVLEQWNG